MLSAVESATSSRSAPGGNTVTRQTLQMLQAVGRKPNPEDPAVIHETAAKFASELFLVPLLAEMRQFPFGRDLARGGQTEAIFGEQFDQRVADQVAASTPGLVDQIVRQMGGSAPLASERVTWLTQSRLQPGEQGGRA